MLIAILIVYLLILSIIAFISSKQIHNQTDFFVARKQGNFFSITGSLLATILGGSAIIGAIDSGPTMGWAACWYMLCASIGLLFLIPLLKPLHQLGRFTLPELLEDLYHVKAKKIASFIIPVAWLGIITAQVIASARILESFTTLNYQTGVIVSGLVFTGYTLAGGQISILKTDFIQTLFILGGLVTIVIFTGSDAKINPIERFNEQFPFHKSFNITNLLILLITYATTFTAGPDIYTRIFCASSLNVAKRSVFTAAIILIPVAFIIGYLNVYGSLMPETNPSGARLIEISNQVLPNWLSPFIILALLSAVLSSADTTILSSSIIITDLIEKKRLGESNLGTTRIIILIIGILSMSIALQFNSIIGMLLIALSVYSGAFVVPLIFGLVGYQAKAQYVSAAIIIGGLLALTGKIIAFIIPGNISNYMIVAAFAANITILLWGRKKAA